MILQYVSIPSELRFTATMEKDASCLPVYNTVRGRKLANWWPHASKTEKIAITRVALAKDKKIEDVLAESEDVTKNDERDDEEYYLDED